jgi:hypothetical protein
MKGQWTGKFAATGNQGTITLDIDEYPSGYKGIAYLISSVGLPAAFVTFQTQDTAPKGTTTGSVKFLSPNAEIVEWDTIKHQHPGVTLARTAQIEYDFTGSMLHLKWTTATRRSADPAAARYSPDGYGVVDRFRAGLHQLTRARWSTRLTGCLPPT